MNQERLDDLEDRIDDLENKNGWDEWGKHVLKELERLNDCQERIENDNKAAHKDFYKKLDEQKEADEQRFINCNDRFLPSKFFTWLLIALIALFGGIFSITIAHIENSRIHNPATIERTEASNSESIINK